MHFTTDINTKPSIIYQTIYQINNSARYTIFIDCKRPSTVNLKEGQYVQTRQNSNSNSTGFETQEINLKR